MAKITDSSAASRAAALERLAAFVPHAGKQYAARRNYDRGAGNHVAVSTLSPYLRRRCIGEWEVIREVLQIHSYRAAEKYIQEVCWRTYWKGWLESRPRVWRDYMNALDGLYMQTDTMQRIDELVHGESGIESFDYWCRELKETGYLHNHARMWFASIWIFTFKLPWQLGADFFMRYLLDGDAASNTLSWRWVAGLQTRGKTYLARADNIAKYTNERFHPAGQLATEALALTETEEPSRVSLPEIPVPVVTGRTGLLLTDDDLHPDALTDGGGYESLAGVTSINLQSPGSLSTDVTGFTRELMRSALKDDGQQSTALYEVQCESDMSDTTDKLVEWALEHNLNNVVCAYAPVGPNQSLLLALKQSLQVHDVKLQLIMRDWDRLFWPHAGKGFFALKKKIPSLLESCSTVNSNQLELFSEG